MFIHEEKKIIFLHNVKCGGCYLRKLLKKQYDFKRVGYNTHDQYPSFFDDDEILQLEYDTDPHTIKKQGIYRFYSSHQDNLSRNMDDYFVFTFVRNPYEKIISAYNYLKRIMTEHFIENGAYYVRGTPENIDYFVDLPTFILNRNKVCTISFFHAFITQYDMLINDEHKINLSFIGRKESLDNDLLKIMDICQLDIAYADMLDPKKKMNQSILETDDITQSYDEDSFLFVNQFFDIDFDTFGYKKYDSFQDFKDHYMLDKAHLGDLVKKQMETTLLDVHKLIYQNKMVKQDIHTQLSLFHINMETIKKKKKNYELEFLALLEKDVSEMNIVGQKALEEIDHFTNILFKKTYFYSNDDRGYIFFTCVNCHYKTYNELSHHCHNKTCKKNINI